MSGLFGLVSRRKRRNSNTTDIEAESMEGSELLAAASIASENPSVQENSEEAAPECDACSAHSAPNSVVSSSAASALTVSEHQDPGLALAQMVGRRARRRASAQADVDDVVDQGNDVASVHSVATPLTPPSNAPIGEQDIESEGTRRKARTTQRRQLLREGEKPMTRDEVCERARKARSHNEGRGNVVEAAEAIGRAAVAQVFTDAVTYGHREALASDAAARAPVPRGTDGRAWMTTSSLRRVFKELQDSGSFGRREGISGICPSRTTDLAALVAVSQTVLDEQNAQINDIVEAGGSVMSLQLEFDATPQQLAMYSAEARDILRGPEVEGEGTADLESREKYGTRDVFVQRARMRVLDADPDDAGDAVNIRLDEEIFIAPLALGQQDSGTLRAAVLGTLKQYGLEIKRLSEKNDLVVLILSQDGCFTNSLFHDWLASNLPDNVILLKDLCQSHTVNRIVIDHVNKSKFDINSLFNLSRVVHNSTYFDLLCSATLTVAFEVRPAWIQAAGPSRA